MCICTRVPARVSSSGCTLRILAASLSMLSWLGAWGPVTSPSGLDWCPLSTDTVSESPPPCTEGQRSISDTQAGMGTTIPSQIHVKALAWEWDHSGDMRSNRVDPEPCKLMLRDSACT